MHNIITDDPDSSISYYGEWDDNATDTHDVFDYNGSHHVSFDSSANATWNFTGVAFYYIAAQWAYPVNTLINIDNSISYNVSLDDTFLTQTASSLPDSGNWSVLWGCVGLENTLHTVVASMPVPGPQFIVVDAFMYTVLDPGDADDSPTTPVPTVSPTPLVPTLPSTSVTLSSSAISVSTSTVSSASTVSASTVPPTPTSSGTSVALSGGPGAATSTPASGTSPTTQSSSAVPKPLIAGLLAAVLFVLAAILIYWLWRRRKGRSPPDAAGPQQDEAEYFGDSIEKSHPSTPVAPIPVVQPPSNRQNSACLLCRSRPKNGEFDFCGIPCRDAASNLAPLVLEVPQGHATFTMVENKFQQSWKAGSTPCPRVKNVYRIIVDLASVQAYDNYLWTHGNESFRYHGTERSCALGVNGHTILCTSPTCNVCSIIRTSFEVSLSDPGGAFGQGIYTSSASNKSASYSPNSKIMFLTKVVLGNVYTVNEFAEVRSCPPGYQSVVFNRLNGTRNETVVYTNDAIRPVFLIAFE